MSETKEKKCECDIDTCAPQGVGIMDNEVIYKCDVCGGSVTTATNDRINQIMGAMGYDDYEPSHSRSFLDD